MRLREACVALTTPAGRTFLDNEADEKPFIVKGHTILAGERNHFLDFILHCARPGWAKQVPPREPQRGHTLIYPNDVEAVFGDVELAEVVRAARANFATVFPGKPSQKLDLAIAEIRAAFPNLTID